jgi:hypothetical protein
MRARRRLVALGCVQNRLGGHQAGQGPPHALQLGRNVQNAGENLDRDHKNAGTKIAAGASRLNGVAATTFVWDAAATLL